MAEQLKLTKKDRISVSKRFQLSFKVLGIMNVCKMVVGLTH